MVSETARDNGTHNVLQIGEPSTLRKTVKSTLLRIQECKCNVKTKHSQKLEELAQVPQMPIADIVVSQHSCL